MKDVVDFIKGFDLHTIIIVGIAFWLLNGSLGSRIDKLEERVTSIDARLSRIEGAFSVRNFCVFKDDSKSKNVEEK